MLPINQVKSFSLLVITNGLLADHIGILVESIEIADWKKTLIQQKHKKLNTANLKCYPKISLFFYTCKFFSPVLYNYFTLVGMSKHILSNYRTIIHTGRNSRNNNLVSRSFLT